MDRIKLSAPCSHMDVERMQTWLEDMAMEGWLLEKPARLLNKFWFQRIEPLKIRYRITTVSDSLEYWNERPDTDRQSLAEAFGWEYVCTCRWFHVYRAYDPEVRELVTDPAVQAETLRQARRKAALAACAAITVPLAYVLMVLVLCGPNMVLRNIVFDGMFFYSRLFVLILFLSARGIRDSIGLNRIYRALKQGRHLTERKEWKQRASGYRLRTRLTVVAVVLVVLFSVFYRMAMRDAMDYKPIPEDAQLPFTLVTEFAEQDDRVVSTERLDVSDLRQWSHLLSQVNYDMAELVDVTVSDGTVGLVSMELRWHEMRSEWLARAMYREYAAEARDLTPMEGRAIFDECIYYRDYYDNPAVVLRKGNTVIRVNFPREDIAGLDLEHWLVDLEARFAE